MSEENKSILELARQRFESGIEATNEIRKLAVEDLEFSAGNQWPDDAKKERAQDNRPCLVINRIPQFIRQVTNDQKQNKPAIKVFPVDDKGDVETAKIMQGIVRHIEYNSNANVAYNYAFDGAVRKGFGFFRIITDYVSPTSFDQEILIKKIQNHFSVVLDPNHIEPDGSDCEWGFIFDDIPKEEYLETYKDSELASMDDWQSIGSSKNDWIASDKVRIAEYFYKEYEEKTILQLSDGSTVFEDDFDASLGIQVSNKRKTQVPVVKWAIINGIEVLEQKDFPCYYIPIIPVYGEEVQLENQRIFEGIVRHAKDSQRMYNYWASSETEAIALAPRAPYLVADGQIPDNYKEQWSNANRRNYPYLTYKPTTIGGQVVGAPQRNSFEPAVQAITNARMQAADDMKATTGIYDSALGAQSREVSGVAIRGRQAQSQTSNYHFVDNLHSSLRHAGRIIIDLIPKIYDRERAARIIGDDDQQEIVFLNKVFEKNGETKFFDLSAGKYDVAVEAGPSYATKRQEALASMIDLTKSYPQVAQAAGDLMVKNMDWPGAGEIAERLKKMLPPQLADDKNKLQIPPEAQAQIEQMSQMLDQLTQQLNEKTKMIETKSVEIESKERIEFAKMEVDLQKEAMKVAPQEAYMQLQNQINMIAQRLQLLDFNEPIDQDFNPNHEMQEMSGPQGAAMPADYEQTNQGFTGQPQQQPGQPNIQGEMNGQY